MPDKKFTRTDAWNGGFFELGLEVGTRNDERLLAVLKAVWTHPDLDGCYLKSDTEPQQQTRIVPDISYVNGTHLRGLAKMPNNNTLPCGSVTIRETDSQIDFLILYFPMGSLGTAYPVGGYPFGNDLEPHRQWIMTIERWLREVGQYVYDCVQFQLGLIGFEMTGDIYANEAKTKGIPNHRSMGILLPSDHELEYFPSNSI